MTHAEAWGLRVQWEPGMREWGVYVPDLRLIVVRYGMTRRRRHSTLAHEIAHSFWVDRCSTSEVEGRAWRCAARMLIDDQDYATAERLDSSVGGLAQQLAVTTDVIHGYQATLRA